MDGDGCLLARDPCLGVGEQLFYSWDGKANVGVSEATWAEGGTSFLRLTLGERRSRACAQFGGWIKMGWDAVL